MRPATVVGGLGLMWAAGAGAFLLFGNSYEGITCSASSDGATSNCVTNSRSLVEENGSWAAILVALPVALSTLAFASVLPGVHWDKYAGRLAVVGVMLFCIVLLISFGMLFLPSLLLLSVAVYLDRNRGVTAY
jgi:hypothetical protein